MGVSLSHKSPDGLIDRAKEARTPGIQMNTKVVSQPIQYHSEKKTLHIKSVVAGVADDHVIELSSLFTVETSTWSAAGAACDSVAGGLSFSKGNCRTPNQYNDSPRIDKPHVVRNMSTVRLMNPQRENPIQHLSRFRRHIAAQTVRCLAMISLQCKRRLVERTVGSQIRQTLEDQFRVFLAEGHWQAVDCQLY